MITYLVLLYLVQHSLALCGSDVRWSHHFDMNDVFGMWYGVAYAKHTPDATNKPEDIGCVTLYISDADQPRDDWLDWSIPRRNYSRQNWLSYRNNPFSGTRVAGSWLDVRVKRRAKRKARGGREKRDVNEGRRVRVIWDEDGQSMEQIYNYSPEAPGLWTVEEWLPMEREFISRGIDVWYPDDPPRHPDVIRILRVEPQVLVINHCSDKGGGGVFSLILRRSPSKVHYWEWYDFQKEFYTYDLPKVYRKSAVCAACLPEFSILCLLVYGLIFKFM